MDSGLIIASIVSGFCFSVMGFVFGLSRNLEKNTWFLHAILGAIVGLVAGLVIPMALIFSGAAIIIIVCSIPFVFFFYIYIKSC